MTRQAELSRTAARMMNDHFAHTATLLNSGKVLIAGGHYLIPSGGGGESDSEIYDPVLEGFTVTGNLTTPRSSHTATLLNDGTVLVVGGADSNGAVLTSAEIYNSSAGTFTVTGSQYGKCIRNGGAA